MKQVYLVMQASDDPYYPAKVMGVYASEQAAQAQVAIYVDACAQRSGLPIGHEDFWDDRPRMFVVPHELRD